MGRIFISAGHGGTEGASIDPGIVVAGTTEAREMILTRDLIVAELRARGLEVLSVPDELSMAQTLAWINARAQNLDVALEIHADASPNPSVRGATVFYIPTNSQRKAHAELLLLALLRRVPQLPNRGAKPDTDSGTGSLAFCRQLVVPSLLMNVGFLTSPEDRSILQNRRRDLALGIADGLSSWSRAVAGLPPDPSGETYPSISININGGLYEERGIIVNGNAFIPADLVDRLGIDISQSPDIRRITYRNIVYVRAVELRPFNVSVTWDAATRTVILQNSSICPGQIDRIMGIGQTSELQLRMFLKNNNDAGLNQFPDLPRLYREEGSVEGVNYDLAFCQMCVETSFLQFGGTIQPGQNNFGGLGDAAGSPSGASFPSARIGVRAHIQHLKAYGSTAPLVQGLVDPRFRFVARGVAPLVGQLSGRWSADPQYGDKIMALVRRLYESAGIL